MTIIIMDLIKSFAIRKKAFLQTNPDAKGPTLRSCVCMELKPSFDTIVGRKSANPYTVVPEAKQAQNIIMT